MNTFPLISVRDIIIFPNSTNLLQIGRPFTIAAVKESLTEFENKIVITTQRLVEMNNLPDLKQVFTTGCLCKIENQVQFPDGSMKLLISAQSRFKITSIEDKNEIRFCQGVEIARYNQELDKKIYFKSN